MKGPSSLRSTAQGIAEEVFAVWWQNQCAGRGFSHLTKRLAVVGQIRPEIPTRLAGLLYDSKTAIQCAAARTLGQMGRQAVPRNAVRELIDILREDTSRHVQEAAAEALAQIGNVEGIEVVSALTDAAIAHTRNNRAAYRALAMLQVDTVTEEAIDLLLYSALRDSEASSWDRDEATRALVKVWKQAPEKVSDLFNFRVGHVASNPRAVRLVGEVGSAATTPTMLQEFEAILRYSSEVEGTADASGASSTDADLERQLVELLSVDSHRELPAAVAKAVGAIGTAAVTDGVLESLVGMLREPPPVRLAAAAALGKLGHLDDETLELLVGMLQDSNPQLRVMATEIVAAMGKVAANDHILALFDHLLNDQDSTIRKKAIDALERLGPSAATTAILQRLNRILLSTDRLWIRRTAIEALGAMGPAAATEDIVQSLVELTSSADLSFVAIHALGDIGPAAAQDAVVSRLTRIIGDHHEGRAAVTALGKMGRAVANTLVVEGMLDVFTTGGDEDALHALEGLMGDGVRAFQYENSVLRGATTVDVLGRLDTQLPADWFGNVSTRNSKAGD